MPLAIPFIQIFIVLQCLLILLFLSVNKRFTLLPNRILAAFIFLLSAHMLINLIRQHLSIAAPNLGIGFGFCYGPIIYLYARSLTFSDFRVSKRHLKHGIVPILVQLSVFFSPTEGTIYAVGVFTSLAVYNGLIWTCLKQYRFVLSQTRSDNDRITLNWLSYLFVMQLLLLAINMLSEYLLSSGRESAAIVAQIGLFSGLWLLVTFVIFQGMQHPMLFRGLTKEDTQIVTPEANKNSISDEEMRKIYALIEEHMREASPHLNSNLTLKVLARQVGVVPRLVSLAINQTSNKNFSEYVNGFRIKHACHLLTSSETKQMSIMDVMLESGFVTKSNFNRVFKNETGQAPFEFKQNSQ